MLFTDQ